MEWLRNLLKLVNSQDSDTIKTNVGSGADNLSENENDSRLSNVPVGLNMLQGINDPCDEGNKSQLTELLSDPLKALEGNEKLRNAVAAKGKQMGWDLFPTNNVTPPSLFTNNSDSKIHANHSFRTSEY